MSVIWFMQQPHRELYWHSEAARTAGGAGVWIASPWLLQASFCGAAPQALLHHYPHEGMHLLRHHPHPQTCVYLQGCRNGQETSGNYSTIPASSASAKIAKPSAGLLVTPQV